MTTPMHALQRATLEARKRTGDPSLSVGVRAGLYQLQRVTLRPGRAVDVQPLTDWLALPAVLRVLAGAEV